MKVHTLRQYKAFFAGFASLFLLLMSVTTASGADLTMSTNPLTVQEGGQVEVEVTLGTFPGGGSTGDITVQIAARSDSTLSPAEYDNRLPYVLTLPASDGSAPVTGQFTIPILSDGLGEGDETLVLEIVGVTASSGTEPVNYDGTPLVITVRDQDTATVSLVYAGNLAEPDQFPEDMGPCTILVTLDNPVLVPGGFDVELELIEGTAGAGDYLPVTSVHHPGTAGSVVVEIPLVDDDAVEGDETFQVRLGSITGLPSGTFLHVDSTPKEFTILNDDQASLTLTGPPSVLENLGAAVYELSTDAVVEPSANLVVDVKAEALAGDTATAGDDFMPITTVNYSGNSMTLTVPIIDDTAVEPEETYTVKLYFTSPPNLVIFNPDDAFSNVQTTIVDNDTATITLSDATALEGEDLEFTATLDHEVPGGVTVGIQFTDGTATGGTDYENTPQVLTFSTGAPGSVTFSVPTIADAIHEDPPETFTVSMNNLGLSPGVSADKVDITDTGIGTIENGDHEITMTATIHGMISTEDHFGATITATDGTATVEVERNATPTFVVQADPGYHISSLRVNGIDIGLANGQEYYAYTLPSPGVVVDFLVEATFTSRIRVIEASPFGTIYPHPADEYVEVEYGSGTVFQITAHAHEDIGSQVPHNGKVHHISKVLVDDAVLPNIQGENLTTYEYPFSNVLADHTIEALFTSYVNVEVTGPGKVAYGTQVVENTAAGAVVEDSIEVEAGDNAAFVFTPADGYHVSAVEVDSAEAGRPYGYTFENMHDKDHQLKVAFAINSYAVEPVSTYGTIYSDAGETTPATVQHPEFGGTVTFYVDINHTEHQVRGIVIDGLSVALPTVGNTTTADEYTVKNVDNNYLEVQFANIRFSHRLVALDGDEQFISDVPLAATTVAAPSNVMFVFDDSGSMNWDVMIPGSTNQGLYDGYSGIFDGYKIPDARRMEWKSQWFGYNALYYNPTVAYEPWPRVVEISEQLAANGYGHERLVANADLTFPRYHPIKGTSVFNLDGKFFDLGASQGAIILDDRDPGYSDCGVTYDSSGNGSFGDDYTQLRIGQGCTATADGAYATWEHTFTASEAGDNHVYIRWARNSDSYQNVCYRVRHAGGDTEICGFDHTKSCRDWVDLGVYTFAAGTTGSVSIIGATDPSEPESEAQADAVMFSPGGGLIPNAHYYVWSNNDTEGDTSDDGPFLVVFNNALKQMNYYRATGTNVDNGISEHNDVITTLEYVATPPADVKIPDGDTVAGYTAARQNFANWFTYYRERRLSAISAVSRAMVRMENVRAGLLALNDSSVATPVKPIKVNSEDRTDELLYKLYQMKASGGTPLRRALDYAGQYYDDGYAGTGSNPLRNKDSVWDSADEGGECQQSFAILMTDGYWNSSNAERSAARTADNDNNEHGGVYKSTQGDTLADIAMYYYERDLQTSLANKVPTSPSLTFTNDDPASWQHMVTFGISYGLNGTLNPDDYDMNVNRVPTDYPTWPTVSANGQTTIDDMFHAAVNGRGDFIAATNPDELVRALVAIVDNISDRNGSEASVAINGDELYEIIGDDIRMFQTEYNTEEWWGDVKAYQLDTDLTSSSYGQVQTPHLWSAADTMESRLGSDGAGHTGRTILTYNGSTGVTFDHANLSTVQQQHLVPYFAHERSGEDVVNYIRGDKQYEGTDFRTRKKPFGDFVHSRARNQRYPQYDLSGNSVVDADGEHIVDSYLFVGGNDGMLHAFSAQDADNGKEVFAYVPSFVYPHLREYADPAYRHKYYVDATAYTTKIRGASRVDDKVLLIGSLGKGGKGIFALDVTHPEALEAADVLWEYPKPSTVQVSGSATDVITFHDTGTELPDEIHGPPGAFLNTFFTGDHISVAGANCGDGTVGSTTGSNDGVYEVLTVLSAGAYDVIKIPTGSLLHSCGDGKDLTVYRTTTEPFMGYTFGQPLLVNTNDEQINNGESLKGYAVILANGYESEDGTAALVILDPKTGGVLRKIDTGVGPMNGLSQPRVIDVNNDLRADYVYAGDLLGNMWKFDLTATNYTEWQVAYCDEPTGSTITSCNQPGAVPQPLFSGNSLQPITAAPDIMFHPKQPGYMVIFGTGRYLSESDISNKDVQSMYGIWDWAPDTWNQGYLGARIDDLTDPSNPVITLSHAPQEYAANNPVNSLLRQVVWVEGELTEDANGDGVLNEGEDIDGDGSLDTYSYYRIPSNYEPDWTMVQATEDINGDTVLDDKDLVPAVSLGWCFDLPGKLAGADNIDNDGDGDVDEDGERALGERITNDAIIRDGKAILISFGLTGATCNAGAYSFVNERSAATGGMLNSPAFDLNGDGEVNDEDMVMIDAPIDTDGDGIPDRIPGIPTDKAYDGHLYNPAILVEGGEDNDPEEIKYLSSSEGTIETMVEEAERHGVYYWQQAE
ncbi:MAG: hypothetical protein CSA34_03170 [Desulfobulbus propionicus]|nr:MAG: hypothetical protein CSA34_03170 [Desulfobulbus propionicus]